GLLYPKDSSFILEAFSNSDYAGASLDRKSTIGIKIHVDNESAIYVVKIGQMGRLMVFKCSGVYISALWIEVGMDYNWTQTTAMPNVDIPQGMDTGGSPRRQDTMGGTPTQTRMEQTFKLTDNVPSTPHDSPLPGGYTPRSDEGRLKLHELMTMCTKLSKQVLDLEKEKDAQTVKILRLMK
ncbi:hypothetical protein Tco_1261027, partial [Tanacetum coccineum]